MRLEDLSIYNLMEGFPPEGLMVLYLGGNPYTCTNGP
jgi:hypothetical protein